MRTKGTISIIEGAQPRYADIEGQQAIGIWTSRHNGALVKCHKPVDIDLREYAAADKKGQFSIKDTPLKYDFLPKSYKSYNPDEVAGHKMRGKENISGADWLVLDLDGGKPGAIKAICNYFKAHYVPYLFLTSRHHSPEEDRGHWLFITSITLDATVDENDTAGFKWAERELTDLCLHEFSQYLPTEEAIDQKFTNTPSQCIFGIVSDRPDPEYEIYIPDEDKCRPIDMFLNMKAFCEKRIAGLTEASRRRIKTPIRLGEKDAPAAAKKRDAKGSTAAAVKPQKQAYTAQETGAAVGEYTEAVHRWLYDYRHQLETLYLTLGAIGISEMLGRCSSIADQLVSWAQTRAQGAGVQSREALCLKLMASLQNAGCSEEFVIDDLLTQDPDYDTPGDRANLHHKWQDAEKGGADVSPAFALQLYNEYIRITGGTPAELKAPDYTVYKYRRAGFAPRSDPHYENERGKTVQHRLDMNEVLSLLDAISNRGADLYTDIRTHERHIKPTADFPIVDYEAIPAGLSQVLDTMGYKYLDSTLDKATVYYYQHHRRDTYRDFLTARGVTAENWDGTPRINGFLQRLGIRAAGAQTAEYLQLMSRYILLGIMYISLYAEDIQAREGYSVPCDILPVLLGEREGAGAGFGKTELIKHLALHSRFYAELKECDTRGESKRSRYIQAGGSTVVELSELDFRASNKDSLKSLMSEPGAKIEEKYKMNRADYFRSFFYIATTNKFEIIDDTDEGTGRRLAPIILHEPIRKHLDVYSAEGRHLIEQCYCEARAILEKDAGEFSKVRDALQTELESDRFARVHSRNAEAREQLAELLPRAALLADIDRTRCLCITVGELAKAAKKESIIAPRALIRNVLEEAGYKEGAPRRINPLIFSYGGGYTLDAPKLGRYWIKPEGKAQEAQTGSSNRQNLDDAISASRNTHTNQSI